MFDVLGLCLTAGCLVAAAYVLGYARGYRERGRHDAAFMKRTMAQIIDEAVRFATGRLDLRRTDPPKYDA